MNGFFELSSRLPARGLLALSVVLALGGCADVRRAASVSPVNPESPVAGQVSRAARGSYAVPRLSDVPPVPKNVPTAASVKSGVVSMVRCRGGVDRYALTHPPLSGGAETFASNERDLAQVNPADVPPADSAVLSETDAARLRDYAAPPSAIVSGPPPTPSEGKPPAPSAPAARPAPPAKHARAAPRPHPAKLSASPPNAASVAPAVALAAPVSAVTASSSAPPLPAPLPDPFLARCS